MPSQASLPTLPSTLVCHGSGVLEHTVDLTVLIWSLAKMQTVSKLRPNKCVEGMP